MHEQAIIFDVEGVIFTSKNFRKKIIPQTFNFIQKYHESYDFFTNTSMPKAKLQRIFEEYDLKKYFIELLAYDDGSKRENVEYIMQVFGFSPENILFIDDKQTHIDAVKSTGVRTLLFCEDSIDLEQEVKNIFGE